MRNFITLKILENLGQVKDGFKLIEEFKTKYVGKTEPRQMFTFKVLNGIATALWFKKEIFSHGPNWKTPLRRPGMKIKSLRCYSLSL